ncbi:DUF4440 domain-containing protein [Pseudoalteromonas phenolica]|uniref:DUF4440 domain-containing protein n=2 Tax=Pseudoalteromonas phenolica TaxID=161398 RepID=A0A5R9Q575_9GAMM|nr:nuclear transport factor 2 family protein [Pseudoalteromonas phenolica]TLX48310.1 DUF4440 domain-containing protein [Pseudoalteromonas phenolica]
MANKMTTSLLSHLIELERRLLDPVVRASKNQLSHLLHDDFYEISANGLMFNKQHVIGRLPLEKIPQIYNQDFKGQVLSDTLAQLTYHAAYRMNVHNALNFSIRMSIWAKTEKGWQLFFHQGTPCPEFTLSYEE